MGRGSNGYNKPIFVTEMLKRRKKKKEKKLCELPDVAVEDYDVVWIFLQNNPWPVP